jgi:positive regulator of sigma E activity
MQSSKRIEHKGTVEQIEDGTVSVNIMNMSACSSCHAKGACNAADMEEKVIDVTHSGEGFSIGEAVNVIMQQSLGFKALFLGYVLPFLLVLIVLIVVSNFTESEGLAGLLALLPLPLYYGTLFLLKDKIKKEFSFTIHKLD